MRLCKNTYDAERNRALLRAYRRLLGEMRVVYLPDLFRRLVELPTERFFVSEERATEVVSRMHRGEPVLRGMLPTKRRMYQDIYDAALLLRGEDATLSLSEAVWRVVNGPAPCFYLTPESAKVILYRLRSRG